MSCYRCCNRLHSSCRGLKRGGQKFSSLGLAHPDLVPWFQELGLLPFGHASASAHFWCPCLCPKSYSACSASLLCLVFCRSSTAGCTAGCHPIQLQECHLHCAPWARQRCWGTGIKKSKPPAFFFFKIRQVI